MCRLLLKWNGERGRDQLWTGKVMKTDWIDVLSKQERFTWRRRKGIRLVYGRSASCCVGAIIAVIFLANHPRKQGQQKITFGSSLHGQIAVLPWLSLWEPELRRRDEKLGFSKISEILITVINFTYRQAPSHLSFGSSSSLAAARHS